MTRVRFAPSPTGTLDVPRDDVQLDLAMILASIPREGALRRVVAAL